MSKTVNYNSYMQRALLRMVGDVLSDVAENGLKGDQHFYISFRTQDKGVVVPLSLADEFPEEMTIVMQGWFDNLAVMNDRFFVTLSFGGLATDLVIPLSSITSFSDPSAEFSLQFDMSDADMLSYVNDHRSQDEDEIEEGEVDDTPHESAKVISFDKFRKTDK